jgi:hypothetical protein
MMNFDSLRIKTQRNSKASTTALIWTWWMRTIWKMKTQKKSLNWIQSGTKIEENSGHTIAKKNSVYLYMVDCKVSNMSSANGRPTWNVHSIWCSHSKPWSGCLSFKCPTSFYCNFSGEYEIFKILSVLYAG